MGDDLKTVKGETILWPRRVQVQMALKPRSVETCGDPLGKILGVLNKPCRTLRSSCSRLHLNLAPVAGCWLTRCSVPFETLS